MKEQFLIRGGRGFIGSHLRSLLEGRPVSLPRHWAEPPTTDHVIYLAGYGNVYGQKDVEETYKANLTEPLRLLREFSFNRTFKSFIFVSSSSVLIPEQTFYSLSKLAMEEVCQQWYKEKGQPIIAVRPSSVTGAGEQPNHLIPTLIRSCFEGEEMPFVPEPTHDFIDVEDFCEEVIYLTQHATEYAGRVLNLSSGVTHSNQEVLELVEAITGKKANIRLVESMRKYDTKDWVVEDSFPDFPKRPLSRTIEHMVQVYKNERANN